MSTGGASTEVYAAVRSSIEGGGYPPGSRLPSERVLSTRFGVSRATLRNALTRLAEQGVIEASAQRGWFAAGRPLTEPPSRLQSFSEMARARGLRPTARLLSRRPRPADLDESQRLHIAPTSPVLEIRRVRGMDDTPVCVDRAVLPLPLAAPLLQADLRDASLYGLLHELCDVTVHRSAYSVRAEAASPQVARLLGVEVGSPVLSGREVTLADDGRAVNLGLAQYRGDAYEFQADLFRPTA